jgi:hypothetical protein
MNCVNIKERFGGKYRITYEESYYAQYGENARVEDAWLQIIPCRRGHLFPWGGDKLAASTNSRGSAARRLAGLDFVTVVQDGDDGVTVLFPVERFAEIAEIMGPRRRRQVSDAERARLAGLSRRFSPFRISGAPENAPESTQAAL